MFLVNFEKIRCFFLVFKFPKMFNFESKLDPYIDSRSIDNFNLLSTSYDLLGYDLPLTNYDRENLEGFGHVTACKQQWQNKITVFYCQSLNQFICNFPFSYDRYHF